ncbi:hypothetical protein GCM10010357_70890 [Streptomyces luteireticuli]|uniref:Uncharacterized protein n=1 Tax=Streptomyces luteireticuli TaxID=173858 RepID=A0ABN0Z9Z4_9ACTN
MNYAMEVRASAVYAPTVPIAERTYQSHWGKRRTRRHTSQWPGKILLHSELVYLVDNALAIDCLANACAAAWRSAEPLAGVLDLTEIDRQLDSEQWLCAQLMSELHQLVKLPYDTKAAQSVLVAQFTQRITEIEALAEENRRLYQEAGADPLGVPDAVRTALLHAQALADEHPSRDTAAHISELRRLVRENPTP